MIPQANIVAWRAMAPWPDDAQVEQDLVLSRAVVELFAEPGLAGLFALRGGTALNKLFITPGARYSEDIDLVQTKAGAAGPLIDAIRNTLDPWLGKPARGRAEGGISLTYRFDSEIPPVRPLRLKIEINTREHFSVLGLCQRRLEVKNPWFTGAANLTSFQIDELIGTKLRALYQRRKSRDFFDLWLCLDRDMIDPAQVVTCFLTYMDHGGHRVTRAQFEQNFSEKQTDVSFMEDVRPLLSPSVSYEPNEAARIVRSELIDRLPGDPWRGSAK